LGERSDCYNFLKICVYLRPSAVPILFLGLGRLARIDMSGRIALPPITAACDVGSPLLGNEGATRIFGPQKGADAASIPMLENVLETMVRVSDGGETAQCPGREPPVVWASGSCTSPARGWCQASN
jgi:hypothetical protein